MKVVSNLVVYSTYKLQLLFKLLTLFKVYSILILTGFIQLGESDLQSKSAVSVYN